MSLSKQSTKPVAATPLKDAPRRPSSSALVWLLLFLPLGYLWFRLIANLQVEWETNPQYSYGYIVPFLCLGLAFHRWQGLRRQLANYNPPFSDSKQTLYLFVFAFLAFFYLPTRLIEVATPEWRPIQWALGFIAIGLTLGVIYLGWGKTRFQQMAFPICFFLVSIPWPSLLEQPIIQSLTRINAAMVIEVMGFLGVPALQHGNVIEVGTGVVGIDEACSGIRSFQSSIMISLFLGALYDLTWVRRILFVPIGFILAMIFNVVRTSFLTWIAAKQGVAAIDKYHDPAGLWILMGCTIGLWCVGLLLKKRAPQPTVLEPVAPDPHAVIADPVSISNFKFPTIIRRFSVGLLVWLVFVEVGVQAWYRNREVQLVKGPDWVAVFPTNNPTLTNLPIAAKTLALLRFDNGEQAAWTEPDGTHWAAFYFNWKPGRVAGYLAKRHTPEICMPATGLEMRAGPELMVLDVQGLQLPVRRYVFGPPGNCYHVYHCRWEAGARRENFVQQESARFNLIRGVWAGRGNQGQKIIEIIISGIEDPEAAKAMLIHRLENMVLVETPAADVVPR